MTDRMFPWPVFKVSGPWGTGTGTKVPRAQGPESRIQNAGGVIEGKLSNLGKGMAPDLGIEGDDGMWGQAGKRSKQGKKQPPTRGTCGWLAGFSPELASHHGSSYGLLLGPGPQEGTCPLSLGQHPVQDVGLGQTSLTRPPQATARKGKQKRETAQHSLALPISNLTATRILGTTPTANSICTSSSDLPACQLGPALPFVTLINCVGGRSSAAPAPTANTHQGFYHDA